MPSAVEAHRHEQVTVVHGFVGIRFLLAVEFHRLDRRGHLHADEWFADGAQTFDQVGRVEGHGDVIAVHVDINDLLGLCLIGGACGQLRNDAMREEREESGE